MTQSEQLQAGVAEGSQDSTRRSAGASLELKNLEKSYGSNLAVNDVSLTVAPGEFVTLLGPSGSGKTTTLNMIAGFLESSGGEILMDGKPLSGLPTHKRNIGVVFQHYALFPHMTVAQNIAFPLKRRRVPKAEIGTKVDRVLEMVDLREKKDARPRNLSGGQQQRVALARALVFEPRVLLMDEPLGALDRMLRERLQLEIKRIHKQLGITFIYVTHDQEEALVLSDRIAVFNEGRIEQCAVGDRLYEAPQSLFVAEFLGDSNVFSGVLRNKEGAWRLDCSDCTLGAPMPDGITHGEPAALVVRPEKISVGQTETAVPVGTTALRGRVAQIMFIGAARKAEVVTADGRTILVRDEAGRTGSIRDGDDVSVYWDPADATLLSLG